MENDEKIQLTQTCGCEGECECVIACDIQARPRGAPGMPEMARSVRGISRDDNRRLRIEFEPGVLHQVEAMVEAERLCCPNYGWEMQRSPVRLTITAPPAVLDVFEEVLKLPTNTGGQEG